MSTDKQQLRETISAFVRRWQGAAQKAVGNESQPTASQDGGEKARSQKRNQAIVDSGAKELAADLSVSLPIRYGDLAIQARLTRLMARTVGCLEPLTTSSLVTEFVDEVLDPNQTFMHQFLLGNWSVAGADEGFYWQLVNDWTIGTALWSPTGKGGSEASGAPVPIGFLLRRALRVPKEADPGRVGFASWIEAQVILEGMRLYKSGGVFFADEAFSPDYPYTDLKYYGVRRVPPASLVYSVDVSELPRIQSFLNWWLPRSPRTSDTSKLGKSDRRLSQALWRFASTYEAPDWQRALLDAVSSLEMVLDIGEGELKYRFAARLSHLLAAWNSAPIADTYSLARDLYSVRSAVAHGDWDGAERRAVKLARDRSLKADVAGYDVARQAMDMLRQVVLLLSTLADQDEDPERWLDEARLFDPAQRHRLADLIAHGRTLIG